MAMTLWPRPPEKRTTAIQDAEDILRERLWLPVYEQGGLDALIEERLISPPPPPRPDPSTDPSGNFRL